MHSSVLSPPFFFGPAYQKKVCPSVLPIHTLKLYGAAPAGHTDVWCCLRRDCLFLVSSCPQTDATLSSINYQPWVILSSVLLS